mmetsp:Transcript_26239/g.104974  ORF Transcript_26239/g.104974 Transcript_26239/m.104974 type:complete len:208 (-) Transcript_26239:3202-3825(-)
MKHASIIVPVRGRDDVIEVFDHELPMDPADVVEMLRAELAPLDIWCDFAVAYYGQGCYEQFRDVLLGVVDAFDFYEMQELYRREHGQFAIGRLRVLNLLAASATASFSMRRLPKETRDAWRNEALDFIGRAEHIDPDCPTTVLCKSLFWVAECFRDKEALANAAYYARKLLQGRQGSTSVVQHCRIVAVLLASTVPSVIRFAGCAVC